MHRSLLILYSLLLVVTGCSSGGTRALGDAPSERIVCFVPGVGGGGGTYSGLKKALIESGASDLRVLEWGASGPLFVMNFQDPGLHEKAENELAGWIRKWLEAKPGCVIDLVSHSAGGGVILGALKRLDGTMKVRNVVLLSPSVSPGYDLAPALRHVSGEMHNFHSERDVASLKWRTGTFGTYDNVKTPAAGHGGFKAATPLPAELAGKLVQHPYDPAWEALGNDGSHTGAVAGDFARKWVTPLVKAEAR